MTVARRLTAILVVGVVLAADGRGQLEHLGRIREIR